MKYLAFYHNAEVTTLVAREVIFSDDQNYIEITETEFTKLQNVLSDFTKIIKVKEGQITIQERYSSEELAKIKAEKELLELQEKAQIYLNAIWPCRDWLFFEKSSAEEKELVRAFINQCNQVINGKLRYLPDLDELKKRLLWVWGL
jgi:hypothetical protein